jgi:hypothetical protein
MCEGLILLECPPVPQLFDLCTVLAGDGLGESILVELLHVLGEVVLTLRVQHGRKTSVLEPFKVLLYGSESLIPSPNFTNLWYRLQTRLRILLMIQQLLNTIL